VASSTATSTPHSSSSPSPPESASQSASSTSSTSSHNVVYQQATSTPHPLTLTQSSSLLVNIQEPGSPINDPLPPYQRPNYPPRPLPSTPRSPGCSPIASPIRSLPPAPPPPQTPLPPIPTKRPQTPQTPQQQQAYLYTTPSPLPPLPPHPSPASPFPAPIRTKQLDQKTAAEDEEEDNEENEESDAHYTDASSTSQPRNAAVPASVDLAVSPTEERDNPFGASAPDLPQKDVPSASISVATATSGRVDRQSELKDETASNDSTQTLPLNDINDSPEHAGRRESIASTASRGSSVMTQRKAGMPGLALGLDGECNFCPPPPLLCDGHLRVTHLRIRSRSRIPPFIYETGHGCV
jgi:hypothetical protein